MATCRKRFVSSRDIVLVFASCAVPVYSWSILAFFRELPAWLFHLNAWDVASIFAYAQAFALLESAIVSLVVILLSVLLPARLLRDRFVSQGSIMVLLTAGYAIAAQYTKIIPFTHTARWLSKRFLLGAALYVISIGVSCLLIGRYRGLEKAVRSLAERFAVMLYVYIPVTFLSVIVVVFRNV